METNIIKEVYVQSNCLQGENLAMYALWDKEKNLSLEINIPKGSQVVAINNAVAPKEIDEGKLKLNEFYQNGYVGIILKTERISAPAYDAEFIFRFEGKEGSLQTVVKKSHLFRPSVKALEVPKIMQIKTTKTEVIALDNKIKIRNEGEGLALIAFHIDDDSELEVSVPEKLGLFIKGFNSDLTKALTDMASKYPAELELIKDYISIFTSKRSTPSDTLLKKLKKAMDGLEQAINNDASFGEDFEICFANAFYRNISIITDFESLLAYVASVTTKKIVLMTPINTIKLQEGTKRLKGKINVVDLGLNMYNSIPIDITIRAEAKGELPIYKIFD